MNPFSSKDQFRIIPHDTLHPDLKAPAEHIKSQNIGRLAGCIIYPALSLRPGLSFMWVYTPFCVGTHHTSIRYAYKAALETVKSGDIADNSSLNDEIKSLLAEKSFSRFHINYKGDLVLHTKTNQSLSFSNLKGITLKEKESNPLLCKIQKAIHSKRPNSISYFHLEQDAQEQMDKVMHARQLRFRACMATVIVSTTLGTMAMSHHKGKAHPLGIIQCIFIGALTYTFSKPSFRVEKHTDDLWKLIQQKNDVLDIIKLKHKGLYQPTDFNKDLHLHVSTFGNINYSYKKVFTLRNQHSLNSKS